MREGEENVAKTKGTAGHGRLAKLALATLLAIVSFGELVGAPIVRVVTEVRVDRTARRGRWHGRAQRAVTAAHAIILGLGVMIVVIAVIIILSASNYFPELTPFYLLISGIVLVFLGLIETVIGEEEGRGRRSRD